MILEVSSAYRGNQPNDGCLQRWRSVMATFNGGLKGQAVRCVMAECDKQAFSTPHFFSLLKLPSPPSPPPE